ncbi:MAG: S41 family peptidase [Opitutales bacterium]
MVAVAAKPADPQRNLEIFDRVWETVNETYFDAAFGGVDWAGLRASERPRAEAAESLRALSRILNDMLGQLGVTHFAVTGLGDDAFDAARLSDVVEDENITEDPVWQGGYSGLALIELDGTVVVREVFADSPAQKAGVEAGMELLGVGERGALAVRDDLEASGVTGARLRHIWPERLQRLLDGQAPGTERTLRLRQANGRQVVQTLRLAARPVEFSEELGYMPAQPMVFTHRELGEGMDYVHFNLFLPQLMPRIREAVLGARQGLILDLRGNAGGVGLMAGGVAGLLIDERLKLGRSQLRTGWLGFVGFPQRGAFSGPVAVLIDAATGSTAELLAGGLQQAGRARVFGQTSAGAAMASLFTELPGGGRFQYVVGDLILPDGTRLDGTGVVPDVSIPLTRQTLASPQDETLEAALAWLYAELAPVNTP